MSLCKKNKILLISTILLVLTGCGNKLPVSDEELEEMFDNSVIEYYSEKEDSLSEINNIRVYEMNVLYSLIDGGFSNLANNYLYIEYESDIDGCIYKENETIQEGVGVYTKSNLTNYLDYDLDSYINLLETKFNTIDGESLKENVDEVTEVVSTENVVDSNNGKDIEEPAEIDSDTEEDNFEDVTTEYDTSESKVDINSEAYTDVESAVMENDSSEISSTEENNIETSTDINPIEGNNTENPEETNNTEESIEQIKEVYTDEDAIDDKEVELTDEQKEIVEKISEVLNINTAKRKRTKCTNDLTTNFEEVSFSNEELRALIILSDIDIRYYMDTETSSVYQIFTFSYKDRNFVLELKWQGGNLVEVKSTKNFVIY